VSGGIVLTMISGRGSQAPVGPAGVAAIGAPEKDSPPLCLIGTAAG